MFVVGIVFVLAILCLFLMIAWVLEAIGRCFMFRKMGIAPWKGIIPVYNRYLEFNAVWSAKWFAGWVFAELVAFVCPSETPGTSAILAIATIAGLAFRLGLSLKLAEAFGRSVFYGVLLFFFPFVMYLVTGLSKDIHYYGPLDGMIVE